jgi:hypothetical protein
MLNLEDGTVLLTFPFISRALIIDSEFHVVGEFRGDAEVRRKGFVSINGVDILFDNQLLFTDSFEGVLRVFDADTGEYSNHLEIESDDSWYRLRSPQHTTVDPYKRLWIYEGGKKRIIILRML